MTSGAEVLRAEDWDQWYGLLELAFGGVPAAPEERELYRRLTEPERSLAVWDEAEVVGTAGAFTFRVSVPGGRPAAAAGVTMVGVAPTHRRRSILTTMMRRQLDDVRARGEALAVLTASEPEIYGRFGYGVASMRLSAEIDTALVRLTVPAGTEEVTLRRADPQAALGVCEELYGRQVAGRPGMLARAAPGWEELGVLDPPSGREGASPLQCVLAERDGEVVGYTRYRTRPAWASGGPDGSVVVQDLEAPDPAVYAALLRYLCGIDLMRTVKLPNRPVDDAWQYLVSDLRRCEPRLRDELQVRLVEVGAALRQRSYRAPLDVVFEVSDAFCPWNEGRWRLSGDAGGAACERTEAGPDLALSVRELGAAYLGGVPLSGLAAAGRVRELRRGALAQASTAFGSDVAPWLPHGF
ncbi:GNAT family N-acetyltransferase [Streptomyces sp. SID8014]|uniref:GNAT family N-acetyltransferase n=1 Tax=Streptomyces sp. SID8014 TaxID=2706097 RepID=UPI0013B5C99F|nr:GNAT family N-acetyltransferase [Streptomyces sp. SID8014]NEC12774.1 GNAT family N-acetyltransferase [Streptomyces sp. SID8014]